jgi:hypothetical protein
MIPYAKTYSATMRGRVLKSVHCEQCRAEFVYSLEREAVGVGTSILFLDNEGASKRAASDAEKSLQKTLDQECDPVPCPSCGWYQAPMVKLLRKQHRSWLVWAGGILLFVGVVVALLLYINLLDPRGGNSTFTTVTLGILVVTIPLGIGLIYFRRVMAASFDPNAEDLATRKKIAGARALLREELDRILEEERRASDQSPSEH